MKQKQFILLGLLCLTAPTLKGQGLNLQWARQAGSTGEDICYSMVTDASGNIYTTGYFENTVDFDPGAGTFNLTALGTKDGFVCKLNSAGAFVWARQFGGISSVCVAEDLALDGSGNVFIAGGYDGAVDFDPGVPAFMLSTPASYAGFLSKLTSGGTFISARSIGGDTVSFAGITSVALDPAENVYLCGVFKDSVDFDSGPGTYGLTSVSPSFTDMFFSKLDASGTLQWAKHIGGVYTDAAYALAVDASGNAFASGFFYGAIDFDPGAGIQLLGSAATYSTFVNKFDASGNFVWAKGSGSPSTYADGPSIALDATGNVYTAGWFVDTVNFGSHTVACEGVSDGYVCKQDPLGNYLWAKSFGGTGQDIATSIALDPSGNVYTTGYFNGTGDFDPGAGTFTLSASVAADIYISALDPSGNFIFAKSIQGSNNDYSMTSCFNSTGDFFVAGYFLGDLDCDPGIASYVFNSAGSYDMFTAKYALGTGLETHLNDNNFVIFPNPGNGIFQIRSSAGNNINSAEVFNVLGEKIVELELNSGATEMNLSDLPAGVYFCRVWMDREYFTEKICIQK